MLENHIQAWCMAWFHPKWDGYLDLFEEDCYYSESWGPEYHGICELKQWFDHWHTHSRLLAWDIKAWHPAEDAIIIEWTFSYADDKKTDTFDGCSIITEGPHGKIQSWKEFASSLPKYSPGYLLMKEHQTK